MRGVISIGRGAAGALAYVLNDKTQPGAAEKANTNERATIIGTNLDGNSLKEFSKQFGDLYRVRAAQGKDKPKEPVRHMFLSLPKGERLTDEQWQQAGTSYLQKLGYIDQEGQPLTHYLLVRHDDTELDHIHIVTTLLKFDGNLVNSFNEKQNTPKFVDEVRAELGLVPIPRIDYSKNYFEVMPHSVNDTIQQEVFTKAQGLMAVKKQWPLLNLSKILQTDLSKDKFFKEQIVFCSTKNGSTIVKLKDNISLTLTHGDDGSFKTFWKYNQDNEASAQAAKKALFQHVALTASATPAPQPRVEEGATETALTVQVVQPQQDVQAATSIDKGSIEVAPTQQEQALASFESLLAASLAPAPATPQEGTQGAGEAKAKLSSHSAHFPHLGSSSKPAATPNIVDIGAITGGMDGSIIALSAHIEQLQACVAQGNNFEAVQQRQKVLGQLANLRTQIQKLQIAKAGVLGKNALNKHNLHKSDGDHVQPNSQGSGRQVKELNEQELIILAITEIIQGLELKLTLEQDPLKRTNLQSQISNQRAHLSSAISKQQHKKKWKP